MKAERLREVLNYNPETGEFHWREQAGSIDANGYRVITIDGQQYPATHLAVLFMTGELPTDGMHVDHRNRTPGDDRWENLRVATPSQNAANTSLYKSNKSGARGVVWDAAVSKWMAYIKVNGKQRTIGRFALFDDACAARSKVERETFGEFSKSA